MLSVIIVNHNVKYFLEQSICSLLEAFKNIKGEIIVVDNNSNDGSRDFFRNKFPCIHFIWNEENEGFAKANNKALKMASGDYILFLNPDTIVPEDCLEKCISFIKSRDDAIALGIKMIDGSGKFLKESKRAFPSPMTSLYKLSGLARLFPGSRTFAKYHLGYLNKNKNHEVDVLAGAFIMVPKKILNDVGSFDENFFMYGEDVDLSYRIQKAGYKNFYFAESCIIHFKGESTKKGSLNYVRMFYKAMSVFVQKHYGGTKAGLFSFFMQTAIYLRAGLAAIAQFLRWVGMKFIDAAIILMSFWIVKILWSTFVKQEVNYSSNMLLIAFPVFTALFLTASYFAGLYDNGYKQSRLNKSTVTAILVILSVYSLLPESLRFSRGILLFGSILAFILMSLVRVLLLKWKIIEGSMERDQINETVIAGTEKEFDQVYALLENAGFHQRILGRIEPGGNDEKWALGNIANLNILIRRYPVKEIIFCKDSALSYKKIIDAIMKLPHHVRIKIYTGCTNTLIGSENSHTSGKFLSGDSQYLLSNPVNRRSKTLIAFFLALFFLLTFPVHFMIKKRPFIFFKNVLNILFLKKTWIGYALQEKDLPLLKEGILTSTGLPAYLNTLSQKSLRTTDEHYAKNFNYINDLKLILANYKVLS
ncbi:MAG: glycosyltransferase family 2 protein [Bacteroidota bacterium]|nr:glycosyltransferase family 2 protein [Bacteroidota bacterium]